MSRTYRKPRWYRETTERSHIDRELQWWRRSDGKKSKWVRRSKEDYELEKAIAFVEFEAVVRENGGEEKTYWCHWSKKWRTRKIRPRHVSRKKRVTVEWTYEDAVNEAKDFYQRMTRDGYFTVSSRSSGFKNEAGRCVRRANKRYCDAVLKDEDHWDECSAPTRKMGKDLRWNWW